MKSPDGMTVPLWYDNVQLPKLRSVTSQQSIESDICVIGAGIAGLTTAYLAAGRGYSVAVVDEGEIAGGQTGRTSAHLASAIDDRFVEIERTHGVDGSRLAYESHAAAIDLIERISKEEKIDCEFKRVNAFLSRSPDDSPDLLDQELAAALRAGFADVEKLATGGLTSTSCLRFGNQARFHPLKYLIGLADAFKNRGGKIYTGRRAMDVMGSDPKKGTPARVKLQGLRKTISAKHVVVATNTPSPINDWFGIYTKQSSYRSYVIAAEIPKGGVDDALYWDTANPYHYVRLESRLGKYDMVIIGGEDHKVGQFPAKGAPFINLEQWGRKHFPSMGEVKFRWSGQIQEPADGWRLSVGH